MKKLILFALCISCLGLQVSAQKKEKSVERYSPIITWLMYLLTSSNSLRDFARSRRKQFQQAEKNEYNTLFQNAQREIGIPDQDILPVKTISRNDIEDKQAYAITSSSNIKVVPQNFDPLSYGAKRITALHESFHNKYHDSVFEAWLFYKIGYMAIITSTLTTIGFWRLIYLQIAGKLKIAGYVGAPVAAFILNILAYAQLIRSIDLGKFPSKYDFFKEFRADRDAVVQVHCYKCIEEYSSMIGSDQYLTQDELKVYIDRLKRKNALCKEHSA